MNGHLPHLTRALGTLAAVAALAAVALPTPALAAAKPQPKPARPPVTAIGTLAQLPGRSGCLADRSRHERGCTPVRALQGPAPFLGSDAVTVSPDGRNVYVASSRSDAVAIFRRNARTGRLTQAPGAAGCIARRGADGCARAVGLDAPNSLAVSADGRNVYVTSRNDSAVAILRRSPSTGALSQATDGVGCIAAAAIPGCSTGRALTGADVVTVSPDGRNVYVGAFFANAVAVFARDASSGALTQAAGTAGCLTNAPLSGCTTGLALGAPEGMAISADGTSVYVAAALSSAVVLLARDPSTGVLSQPTDGTGCITDAALAGCTTGTQLSGADAVTVSPDGATVYVASVLSNAVTTFTRTPGTGVLVPQTGTSACVISILAVGCSLGRAFSGPEGLAASPDGASVYVAAFGSGAIGVLDRDPTSGALMQKPRLAGCVTTSATPDCTPGRALLGVSSIAVSPDNRYVYSAAFASNAVGVFRRITKEMTSGG